VGGAVLDQRDNGATASLICGIDWVTATRTDSDPSNDIAVANMKATPPPGPVQDERAPGGKGMRPAFRRPGDRAAPTGSEQLRGLAAGKVAGK
jgi:hypothetical protein